MNATTCDICGQKISRNALARSSHARKHARERMRVLNPQIGETLVAELSHIEALVKVVRVDMDVPSVRFLYVRVITGDAASIRAEAWAHHPAAGSCWLPSCAPEYLRRPEPFTCPGSGLLMRLGQIVRPERREFACPVCGNEFTPPEDGRYPVHAQ